MERNWPHTLHTSATCIAVTRAAANTQHFQLESFLMTFIHASPAKNPPFTAFHPRPLPIPIPIPLPLGAPATGTAPSTPFPHLAMKGAWLDSPSTAFCPPNSRVANDDAIRNMLSDLPSFGGFTNFDASLPIDAFVQYLPTETHRPQQIRNERKRALVRALSAKPVKGHRRDQKRERKRPAPDIPGVTAKRTRWTHLDRERKQACIRVALAAACRYATPGDPVDKLRQVWQENPRRKQMINTDVRTALAESVSQWTESELAAYLERAHVSGVVTKEGMIRAVRDHLAPEAENDNK